MNFECMAQNFFVLSKLLTYPTKELKDEIKKIVENIKNEKKKENYSLILNILSDESNRENLEAEYTSLFITGYPKTPCPPYYSAYQTGLMVSEHTEELYDIYEKYGIELSNEQFPDFIPTMMEFLTLLLSNNLEEEAKGFYSKYLSWLSEFADNIKRNTKEEYFIEISKVLKEFINEVNSLWEMK